MTPRVFAEYLRDIPWRNSFRGEKKKKNDLRKLTRNLAEFSPRKFAFENFCSRSERKKRAFSFGLSVYRRSISSVLWCLSLKFLLSWMWTLNARILGENSVTKVNRCYNSETLTSNFVSLIPVDVIWRFVSHIVDRKTEIYKKIFIVKFQQNLRKGNSLEMVCFFLRSVQFLGECGQP